MHLASYVAYTLHNRAGTLASDYIKQMYDTK